MASNWSTIGLPFAAATIDYNTYKYELSSARQFQLEGKLKASIAPDGSLERKLFGCPVPSPIAASNSSTDFLCDDDQTLVLKTSKDSDSQVCLGQTSHHKLNLSRSQLVSA